MAGENTGPRNGIVYGWNLGDSTYKSAMDTNLKKIGAMLQMSVKDRGLSAPPGTPANGDTYIVGPSATGLWAGHEDDIAIYYTSDTAWFFLTPVNGWTSYIEDEEVLSLYNGSLWTGGITLDGQLSIADRDLTAPPGSPSHGDAYIPDATATGDWAGEEDNIAIWDDENSEWWFIAPKTGRNMWVVDEAIMVVWNGTAWAAV